VKIHNFIDPALADR